VLQAQTTGVLSAANAEAMLARVGISSATRVGRMAKAAITRLYAGADAFACIARGIERETREAGVAEDRIHFLPNPVDMTRFRPADEAERRRLRREWSAQLAATSDTAGESAGSIPDARLVVAFAGRLSQEKGITELLAAWNELAVSGRLGADQGMPPLLLVAGPDMPGHAWDLGPFSRRFVVEHRLAASVQFLGPLADVERLYRAADLAVVPSHYEALGLSALEALACGLPVVASGVGGILDFLTDGVNGLLCPPRDAPALADRLGTLLTDAELRARLRAQARTSVEGTYDEAVVLGRFAALLSLLTKPRAE
jgi:glycosyltransferase involved in cell wall biosynthesis